MTDNEFSSRFLEFIPYAPYSNYMRAIFSQLLPQGGNVDVYGPVYNHGILPKDTIHNLVSGKYPPRPLRQELQQVKLHPGKLDVLFIYLDLVPYGVYGQAFQLNDPLFPRGGLLPSPRWPPPPPQVPCARRVFF